MAAPQTQTIGATHDDRDRSVRAAALRRIHREQFLAGADSDPELVPRAWVEDALDADVFLVGQALGRDTQRLSGHPYTLPGGPPHQLSRGGTLLDEWLGDIGCTIDPDSTSRRYAYHADVHPGFPGRAKRSGDVVPTAEMIDAASVWLHDELEIIEPNVVVCLGKEAACAILGRYAGIGVSKLMEATESTWHGAIGDGPVRIFAVYHPSGAWQFPDRAAAAWAYVRGQVATSPVVRSRGHCG